ncbi:hypothetical protein XM50_05790 [Sphingomonas sp. Ag1]|nr:hypothetical protein XM50_05790 [Sphingomonas sp. Ag1]
MGVALNDWEGIYLFEDDLIFELGSESTCVTNLFNKTMPLIRYRFDDILVPVNVQNPRMPFRVVSESIGRSQELITFDTGNGDERKFRTVFFDDGVDLSGVKRIQFEKRDFETLAVHVTLVESSELLNLSGDICSTNKLDKIRSSIRQHLDDNGLDNVRLEVFEAIEGDRPEARIVKDGKKEKLVR